MYSENDLPSLLSLSIAMGVEARAGSDAIVALAEASSAVYSVMGLGGSGRQMLMVTDMWSPVGTATGQAGRGKGFGGGGIQGGWW